MKSETRDFNNEKSNQLIMDLKISNNYLLEENEKLRKELKKFQKSIKKSEKRKSNIYELETQISDLQDRLDYIDINSENYEVFKLKLHHKKSELKKLLSELGDSK